MKAEKHSDVCARFCFCRAVPEPVTLYATRGLSQTASAQTMGEGRLTFNVTGSWYRQEAAMPLAPDTGADIITGTGAASFGANNFIDISPASASVPN
jgi:hypothetical protein